MVWASLEKLRSWEGHRVLWSVCGGVCVSVHVVCGIYVCGVYVLECMCVA